MNKIDDIEDNESDIEDMWDGRDSESDERNVEFFENTDHIKLTGK